MIVRQYQLEDTDGSLKDVFYVLAGMGRTAAANALELAESCLSISNDGWLIRRIDETRLESCQSESGVSCEYKTFATESIAITFEDKANAAIFALQWNTADRSVIP